MIETLSAARQAKPETIWKCHSFMPSCMTRPHFDRYLPVRCPFGFQTTLSEARRECRSPACVCICARGCVWVYVLHLCSRTLWRVEGGSSHHPPRRQHRAPKCNDPSSTSPTGHEYHLRMNLWENEALGTQPCIYESSLSFIAHPSSVNMKAMTSEEHTLLSFNICKRVVLPALSTSTVHRTTNVQ